MCLICAKIGCVYIYIQLDCQQNCRCELVFENCFVHKENVLGQEGKGVYVVMSGLDLERLVLLGGPLGLMQACLDVVLPYIWQREQFDAQLVNSNLFRGKLLTCILRCSLPDLMCIPLRGTVTMGKLTLRIVLELYFGQLKEPPKLLFRM
ncbi:hypothetical protein ACSBR2_021655 [Camellia fascicularis]